MFKTQRRKYIVGCELERLSNLVDYLLAQRMPRLLVVDAVVPLSYELVEFRIQRQ